MIHVHYPSEEEELEVVKRTTAGHEAQVQHVMDGQNVQRVQELVRDVPVADHVIRYTLRLVRATRKPQRKTSPGQDPRPDFIRKYLTWGAGPRASQNLILAGKARAILQGRAHVTLEDIRAAAHPVLRHRLITNFSAGADGVTTDDLIDRLIETVQESGVDPVTEQQMNAVMK